MLVAGIFIIGIRSPPELYFGSTRLINHLLSELKCSRKDTIEMMKTVNINNNAIIAGCCFIFSFRYEKLVGFENGY